MAAGAVSLGFARYLRYFVDLPEQVGAAALLVVVTAVALRGIRQSASLTLVLSLVQVGGLVLFGLAMVTLASLRLARREA